MNRFLFGTVVGAALMYWAIVYAPGWFGAGGEWIDDSAAGYRGDKRRSLANEALR